MLIMVSLKATTSLPIVGPPNRSVSSQSKSQSFRPRNHNPRDKRLGVFLGAMKHLCNRVRPSVRRCETPWCFGAPNAVYPALFSITLYNGGDEGKGGDEG